MSRMTRRVQAWYGMVSSPRGWLGAGQWKRREEGESLEGHTRTKRRSKPACVGGWGVGAAALIAPHCASQHATIDDAHHHDDALDRMVSVPPRGKLLAQKPLITPHTHHARMGNMARTA